MIKDNRKMGLTAQALVELVLIFPILLVLIIGALEYGRLFYTKTILTNAAREGAYYVTTKCGGNKATTTCFLKAKLAAENEATNSGINTPLIVTIENELCGGSCFSPEEIASVSASTTVTDFLVLGFLGDVFHITATHGDFPISSTVKMVVQ